MDRLREAHPSVTETGSFDNEFPALGQPKHATNVQPNPNKPRNLSGTEQSRKAHTSVAKTRSFDQRNPSTNGKLSLQRTSSPVIGEEEFPPLGQPKRTTNAQPSPNKPQTLRYQPGRSGDTYTSVAKTKSLVQCKPSTNGKLPPSVAKTRSLDERKPSTSGNLPPQRAGPLVIDGGEFPTLGQPKKLEWNLVQKKR